MTVIKSVVMGLCLALLPIHAFATVPMAPWEEWLSQQEIAGLLSQAEAGNASAQSRMGEVYLYGQGVPISYVKAQYWYLEARKNGADINLVLTEDFFAEHARLYKAAKSGNPDALYAFARHGPHDAGGLKGDAPAAHWLRLAAEQGHADSQYLLGRMYFDAYYRRRLEAARTAIYGANLNTWRPDSETRRLWTVDLDFKGESLESDLAHAKYWLGKAAAQGAQWQDPLLQDLYAIEGTPAEKQAFTDQLTTLGTHPTIARCDAMLTGQIRKYPLGLTDRWMIDIRFRIDYPQVRACYKQVDTPEAWYQLGVLYHYGLGVARDDSRAMTYLLAGDSSSFRIEAAYEMALIYMDSPVIPVNDSEAYVRLNRVFAGLRPQCYGLAVADHVVWYKGQRVSITKAAAETYAVLEARISPGDLAKANDRLKAEGLFNDASSAPMPPMPCV